MQGFLDGTPKRGNAQTDSFKSSVIEAIELCQSGLKERFGSMLCSVTDTQALVCSTTSEVVKDMLIFNVDAWPCDTQDLVDFGNNKIDGLTSWFNPHYRRLAVILIQFLKSGFHSRSSSTPLSLTRITQACGRSCLPSCRTKTTSKILFIL